MYFAIYAFLLTGTTSRLHRGNKFPRRVCGQKLISKHINRFLINVSLLERGVHLFGVKFPVFNLSTFASLLETFCSTLEIKFSDLLSHTELIIQVIRFLKPHNFHLFNYSIFIWIYY